MRHIYATQALVLGRYPIGEASASVILLTPDFGVIRARAQGLRKPGAKMSTALQTFAASDVTLVRGKDGWRMTGAVLETNWAHELTAPARLRAGRILELLLRLVKGEYKDPDLFMLMIAFIQCLPSHTDELQDAAECLAALRLLSLLGLDAGVIPGDRTDFSVPTLTIASLERSDLIVRINNNIAASGL